MKKRKKRRERERIRKFSSVLLLSIALNGE